MVTNRSKAGPNKKNQAPYYSYKRHSNACRVLHRWTRARREKSVSTEERAAACRCVDTKANHSAPEICALISRIRIGASRGPRGAP